MTVMPVVSALCQNKKSSPGANNIRGRGCWHNSFLSVVLEGVVGV